MVLVTLDREQESFQTARLAFPNAEGVPFLMLDFLEKKKYAEEILQLEERCAGLHINSIKPGQVSSLIVVLFTENLAENARTSVPMD